MQSVLNGCNLITNHVTKQTIMNVTGQEQLQSYNEPTNIITNQHYNCPFNPGRTRKPSPFLNLSIKQRLT